METSVQKLYLYNDVRRLLLRGDEFSCYDKDNAPMNKRNIKIHKGIKNTVYFKAFQPTGQAASISMLDVYGRIIRLDTNEQILERKCDIGVNKGTLSLTINEGDIADLDPGLYSLVIVGKESLIPDTASETTAKAFYSDFDSNMNLTLEVTEQAERAPVPSVVITTNDFTETRIWNMVQLGLESHFSSQSIPGNRARDHIHNVHSFSVNADNYTGKLQILGTLDLTPNPSIERGWFTISALGQAEDFIDLINLSGTHSFTFDGNFMWIKIVHIPSTAVDDPGIINKIIARF